MSHLTIASATAFLYAGAIERDYALRRANKGTPDENRFENWEGHTGFVFYAERIATAIIEWLDAQQTAHDDTYPGVIEYELIEPLGAQLIEYHDCNIDPALALHLFQDEYFSWIEEDAA